MGWEKNTIWSTGQLWRMWRVALISDFFKKHQQSKNSLIFHYKLKKDFKESFLQIDKNL